VPPQEPRGGGAASRWRLAPGGLQAADWVVVAGTVLYLVFMLIPWFRVDGVVFGGGYTSPGFSVNGFDSGVLPVAFLLLLVAAVWTVLPALTEVRIPFPRSFVTAGLVAAVFLLTLVAWLRAFDAGFSAMALLTFLTAAALLGVTVLRLLPELREPPSSGGPACGPAASGGQEGHGLPGQSTVDRPDHGRAGGSAPPA
jgi:hypothetical protein